MRDTQLVAIRWVRAEGDTEKTPGKRGRVVNSAWQFKDGMVHLGWTPKYKPFIWADSWGSFQADETACAEIQRCE